MINLPHPAPLQKRGSLNSSALQLKIFIVGFLCLVLSSCENESNKPQPPAETKSQLVATPVFHEDSAFSFVQKQVAFGPRVPNTNAHVACGNWLDSMLRKYADKIYLQTGQVKAYNGTVLNFKNIIAAFNPEVKNRIFLCAHWDTRPFADQDPDPAMRTKPNDGADDGASGVAVLLEVAKALRQQPVKIGVDLILFDVEDYGNAEGGEDTYCLGSQYWAKNLHVPGYNARYGILLDMVGAHKSIFPMEAYSIKNAPSVVRTVWNYGAQLGYSNRFLFKPSARPIVDDHFYINQITGIPAIDIIYLDNNLPNQFGAHWHTHQDNLSIIDKNALKAVGQTLLQTVYQEDKGGL